MRVAELWRYPVKSLRGERLQAAEIAEDGVVGDRLVHVRQQSGRVVTSRFRPRLLGLQGSLDEHGEPLIDGLPWVSGPARERVRAAAGPGVELVRFAGTDHGQRYDILPLTVLTTEMADAVGVDRRRFRPNIVITGADGLAEVEWPGLGLRAGRRADRRAQPPHALRHDDVRPGHDRAGPGGAAADRAHVRRTGRARLLGDRGRPHRRGRRDRARRAVGCRRAAARKRGRRVGVRPRHVAAALARPRAGRPRAAPDDGATAA